MRSFRRLLISNQILDQFGERQRLDPGERRRALHADAAVARLEGDVDALFDGGGRPDKLRRITETRSDRASEADVVDILGTGEMQIAGGALLADGGKRFADEANGYRRKDQVGEGRHDIAALPAREPCGQRRDAAIQYLGQPRDVEAIAGAKAVRMLPDDLLAVRFLLGIGDARIVRIVLRGPRPFATENGIGGDVGDVEALLEQRGHGARDQIDIHDARHRVGLAAIVVRRCCDHEGITDVPGCDEGLWTFEIEEDALYRPGSRVGACWRRSACRADAARRRRRRPPGCRRRQRDSRCCRSSLELLSPRLAMHPSDR